MFSVINRNQKGFNEEKYPISILNILNINGHSQKKYYGKIKLFTNKILCVIN